MAKDLFEVLAVDTGILVASLGGPSVIDAPPTAYLAVLTGVPGVAEVERGVVGFEPDRGVQAEGGAGDYCSDFTYEPRCYT